MKRKNFKRYGIIYFYYKNQLIKHIQYNCPKHRRELIDEFTKQVAYKQSYDFNYVIAPNTYETSIER